MRRTLALFLILAMFLSLAACKKEKENSYTFYYLRTADTVVYGEADGLIAPVSRELSAGTQDLTYLLQQYLDGPLQEGFRSPCPKGTYVLSTILESDTLKLVLSREFSQLEDIQLTLAGACLATTCHELSGVSRIQILSNGQTYEFHLDDFIYLDDSAAE